MFSQIRRTLQKNFLQIKVEEYLKFLLAQITLKYSKKWCETAAAPRVLAWWARVDHPPLDRTANMCCAINEWLCTICHEPKLVVFCEHKGNCACGYCIFLIWTGQCSLSAHWNYGSLYVRLVFLENWFITQLARTIHKPHSTIKARMCVPDIKNSVGLHSSD